MRAYLKPDGSMLIPVPVYGDGIRGDAMVLIGPDDPRYAQWLPFAEPSQTRSRR